MSDNPHKKDARDRNRLNKGQSWEVEYNPHRKVPIPRKSK
jgi:hypothetical protein